jgi:BMFP domain-containing protein YqiC
MFLNVLNEDQEHFVMKFHITRYAQACLYNSCILLRLSALASRLSTVEARLDALHHDVNNDVTAQILSRLSALEARLDSQQHDVNKDVIARLSALEARIDSKNFHVDNDVTPLSSGHQLQAGSRATPIVEEFKSIRARLATLESSCKNPSNTDDRQALVYI